MKNLLIVMCICTMVGCNTVPIQTTETHHPEILTVYNDGTMEYRDRTMNAEDVIIYPDGFGGERAAVRLDVPLKDDYYFRDTIRVHRKETPADTQN